ncbi:hypothetical protein RIF29_41795 [Crotalaria pallida]|uniref:MADS-box domain-containing protein n=1 Tax=Crotalaria pallida TaxID=3830 RepID=A0AAN9E653_CROPI
MGRRKIEIKMVKDTNTRQVTFSKRRTGLFKKANELSILCGAEVAIVVFSPGNKPYSFGHPDVDSVAANFLEQEPKSNGPSSSSSSSSNDPNMERLNQQLADVMDQSREEAKKGEVLDEALKKYNKTKVEDLKEMHALAAELRSKIRAHVNEMEAMEAMLLIKEQPVEFPENHVAKRLRRKN